MYKSLLIYSSSFAIMTMITIIDIEIHTHTHYKTSHHVCIYVYNLNPVKIANRF